MQDGLLLNDGEGILGISMANWLLLFHPIILLRIVLIVTKGQKSRYLLALMSALIADIQTSVIETLL